MTSLSVGKPGLASSQAARSLACSALYEGYAAMFYMKDGVLHEWGGSHCSCNGLEESRFSGSPTSWEALAMRPGDGALFGYGNFSEEARDALKKLIEKNVKNTKKGKKA